MCAHIKVFLPLFYGHKAVFSGKSPIRLKVSFIRIPEKEIQRVNVWKPVADCPHREESFGVRPSFQRPERCTILPEPDGIRPWPFLIIRVIITRAINCFPTFFALIFDPVTWNSTGDTYKTFFIIWCGRPSRQLSPVPNEHLPFWMSDDLDRV